MYLLEDYKRTLEIFDIECSKVSHNGGTDRSVEYESALEALLHLVYAPTFNVTSCHRLTISVGLVSHLEAKSDLTADEQDIMEHMWDIHRMVLFFRYPQWELRFNEETGRLKIFEGKKEVVMDKNGYFFALPEYLARDFYNGWQYLSELCNSDASDQKKDEYCDPLFTLENYLPPYSG